MSSRTSTSSQKDYYAILGVPSHAEFGVLRRSYRRRAMQCHPDRFGGDQAKEEQFKELVEAFDVLSDPVSRRNYDLSLGIVDEVAETMAGVDEVLPEDEGAILDTLADDILEELIVGNTMPEGSSLQTLMLDLERTERFCLFREAKTSLYTGRVVQAEVLFKRYVRLAPSNILAHYFLAQCHLSEGRWREAQRSLHSAIRIGQSREPPLRMRRVRDELDRIRKKRPGFLGAFIRFLNPPLRQERSLDTEEEERRSLNRTINRLAAERLRRPKHRKRLRGQRVKQE